MKFFLPIVFSFDSNKISLKICSIFNDFSIVGQNIMKPMRCTLTHQGLFKIPKARQEAPWFRRSQGDKQNKQTIFFHR
jgi:hypothetical protein